MDKIILSTIVRQSEDYIGSSIGDEIVLMSLKQGSYFSLDKIGSIIWDKIKNEIEIQILCDYLVSISNANIEQCQKDVIEFLENLYTNKMIQIKNE